MLKQLWNKFKTFWFSFGKQHDLDDYFYLENGEFHSFGEAKVGDATLTHREIQQLRSIIGLRITGRSSNIRYWRNKQNEAWEKCNPDDPETAKDFEALCFYNKQIKENKASIKKLVNLQTKLKRLKGT